MPLDAGDFASPGGAVYASMKGAIEALSKRVAKERGPRRVAVNVVALGALKGIEAAASFATTP